MHARSYAYWSAVCCEGTATHRTSKKKATRTVLEQAEALSEGGLMLNNNETPMEDE